MYNKKYPQIDDRRDSDVKNELNALAKSYVPEWKFDMENPDIGSAIAMVFAKQTSDNVKLFNDVFRKYQIEFVNMFGLSRNRVKPAHAVVVVDFNSDHMEGIQIPQGTKLLASSETEDKSLTFETTDSIYVTSNQITDYVFVHEKTGQIFGKSEPPFFAFDENESNTYKNEIYLYHEFFLDETLLGVSFVNSSIQFEEVEYSYLTEEGYVAFENISYKGTNVFLTRSKEPVKEFYDDKEMQVIRIIKKGVVRHDESVLGIEFLMRGKNTQIEFMSDGITDKDIEEPAIFGDELTAYKNCYISHDKYFSKKNAEIIISFELDFQEKKYTLAQEAENLKVIKRRNRYANYYQETDVWIQEISIEYFNGLGWKAIPELREYRKLFSENENKGLYELRFLAPADWEADGVVGEFKRCIRIQTVKVENSFMQPSIHHYPVLKDIEVSYDYKKKAFKPEVVRRISGGHEKILDFARVQDERQCVFQAFPYKQNALYLGFEKPLEKGPISMFWEIEALTKEQQIELEYEYSSSLGFRTLKISDETQMLNRSGIMRFFPPLDMKKSIVFDKEKYWIRIVDRNNQYSSIHAKLPHVKQIFLNAVEVNNVNTQDMQEYYIEEVTPKMSFSLSVEGILKADIWVNEVDQLSRVEMTQMLESIPEKIMIEYDLNREIENFYVLWDEVENFYLCERGSRVYVLDRWNSQVIFGDGIHVRIPQNVSSVGFKVQIKSSDGKNGNVAVNAITDFKQNMMFLDKIYNPMPAYGGGDFETQDKALQRGIGVLSSRHHLITEKDYCRAVLNYSDEIDRVSCVTGYDITHTDKGCISLVLLMKDYRNQNYAFRQLQDELQRYLMKYCAMTVQKECLRIVEPILVTLSVEVWLQIETERHLFEKQARVIQRLESYIEPTHTSMNEGWEIGVLPTESQIKVMVRSVLHQEKVKYISITASYTDYAGYHEMNLQDIKKSTFMIGINGVHKVHTHSIE